MAHWTADNIPSQQNRVAIVTGANSGIGFETALALAEKDASVILACRSEQRGREAVLRIKATAKNARVRFMKLDLSDLNQVEAFANAFKVEYSRLDLLINNAGVMMPPLGYTKQGFELQIGINHFGHFALTGHLLPLLSSNEHARIVNVSSIAHRSGKMDFDDLHWRNKRYSKMAAYGQSKLANLLFTFELQRRLKKRGLGQTVVAAHPGWTHTNLARDYGLFRFFMPLAGMSPAQGALPTLRATTDKSVRAGEYYGPNGFKEIRGFPVPVSCTAAAKSQSDANTLWQQSEKSTGLAFP